MRERDAPREMAASLPTPWIISKEARLLKLLFLCFDASDVPLSRTDGQEELRLVTRKVVFARKARCHTPPSSGA